MAKKTGNQGAVYLGGYDLSGDLNGVDPTLNINPLETTGMSSTSKSYITGIKDSMIAWKGMFDFDTVKLNEIDNILGGALGSLFTATFLPGGDAFAVRSYCGQSELLKDYKISAPVAGLVTIAADFNCSSSNGLQACLVLQPKLPLVGTGAAQLGSVLDNTVSTPNGGQAYFHILGVDPAATVTLKLEHSADNITFTTLATSTLTGAAVGGDSVGIAGTINRFVRRSVTTTTGKNVIIQASLARF